MKRLIALLLCLALLVSMAPNIFAQNVAEPEDLWDQIQRLEDSVYKPGRTINVAQAEQAYAGAIEEIIQLVESSADFVPGSIVRNGDFFFWDQKDGTACGYSPRLRARIRETARPEADPEAYAGIETVSYNTKGGWPSSVNVAAFQPYVGIDGSFTNQYELRCNSIAQALDGVGTTYKTNNATIDNIANALQTCAVVIFDSHGDTDFASGYDYTSRANTSYICLQSGAGFTAEDQATVTGPYGTYKHAYYGGGYGNMNYYMADGTAIANHMTGNSPNGLLWMAICLGMATDGLQAPLREKGVEVVYGYSQSVTFSGDYAWEGKFWPKMIQGDCVKDAIAYMKQQVGIKDPYTNSYPAWPIVASSEDPYPGHGNVDKAQTVYSTWTLFTQYTIDAVSNNPEWGTVSVRGMTINATPKTGYEVDGFELLEGSAEVTRNGDTFEVTPASDCVIQINFAPRDPAVVYFSVPEGVSCDSLEAYVGDMITMPTPTGAPTAQGYEYRFLGWVTAPMDADALELPEFIKAGTKIEVTEASSTYYALYSYFVAQDGLDDDQFLRVDEAPASWAGEYVITYNGDCALGASSSCVGASLGTTKAVVDLAAEGCVVEGNLLNNVTEDITWVVDPGPDGSYTIKMKAANYYLAMASNADSLHSYTSSNTDKTRWTITMGENGPVITNKEYDSRFLQYNSGSGIFRCYTSPQQPLTLFAKADGDTWYTTDPKDKVVCQEHQFGDWTVENEPTCTGSGLRARICTVCGYKQTETLEPLGHAFGEWTVTAEPSCTDQGEESRVCARCATVETRILEATGHEPAEAVEENKTAATCTEDGGYDKVVYCAKCGQELSREHVVIPALGHDYSSVVQEPSCTEQGYTTYTCSRCGDSYQDDYQEALGHEFGEWIVTKAPGCTEDGEESRSCQRCGETETRVVEALGHNWDEGVVTIQPTMLQAGVRTFTCKRCGESYTEEIPKLDFLFEDVKDPSMDYFTPVYWAYNHTPQITKGTDDTHFSPENTVTRGQAVTFLWRAAGQPKATNKTNPFTDAKKGAFYYKAMLWAVENGITKGTTETTFEPNKTCTRGEILTFLYRAVGSPKVDKNTPVPYTDVAKGKYYYKAMIWAYLNGVDAGTSETTFQANGDCSRAAIVTFLYKTYEPLEG